MQQNLIKLKLIKNLTLDLSKVKIQSKIDPKIFNSFKKAIKNISSFIRNNYLKILSLKIMVQH